MADSTFKSRGIMVSASFLSTPRCSGRAMIVNDQDTVANLLFRTCRVQSIHDSATLLWVTSDLSCSLPFCCRMSHSPSSHAAPSSSSFKSSAPTASSTSSGSGSRQNVGPKSVMQVKVGHSEREYVLNRRLGSSTGLYLCNRQSTDKSILIGRETNQQESAV